MSNITPFHHRSLAEWYSHEHISSLIVHDFQHEPLLKPARTHTANFQYDTFFKPICTHTHTHILSLSQPRSLAPLSPPLPRLRSASSVWQMAMSEFVVVSSMWLLFPHWKALLAYIKMCPCKFLPFLPLSLSIIIIIIINPWTARVVGEPQMILQPDFSVNFLSIIILTRWLNSTNWQTVRLEEKLTSSTGARRTWRQQSRRSGCITDTTAGSEFAIDLGLIVFSG